MTSWVRSDTVKHCGLSCNYVFLAAFLTGLISVWIFGLTWPWHSLVWLPISFNPAVKGGLCFCSIYVFVNRLTPKVMEFWLLIPQMFSLGRGLCCQTPTLKHLEAAPRTRAKLSQQIRKLNVVDVIKRAGMTKSRLIFKYSTQHQTDVERTGNVFHFSTSSGRWLLSY